MHNIDLRQRLSRNPQTRVRLGVGPVSSSGRVPSTRSADDLLHLDSVRKKYSPAQLDEFRCRSPDRILSSSRVISPPRNYSVIQRSSVMRSIDPPQSAASVVDQISIDAPMPSTFSAGVFPYHGQTLSASSVPPPNSVMKAPFLVGLHYVSLK